MCAFYVSFEIYFAPMESVSLFTEKNAISRRDRSPETLDAICVIAVFSVCAFYASLEIYFAYMDSLSLFTVKMLFLEQAGPLTGRS
mgnify:CR=1 FL=1